jgi:hypothetical protein
MCYYNHNDKEALNMGIIYQHDKRSGITYAYESSAYWDKEKKMSRAKRKLIGRVNPVTKEITPTDGRGHRSEAKIEEAEIAKLKKLCEKLQKKCAARDRLINSLKSEIAELKECK